MQIHRDKNNTETEFLIKELKLFLENIKFGKFIITKQDNKVVLIETRESKKP